MLSNAQWVIADALIYLFMIIPFLLSIKYRKSQGLYLRVPKTYGVVSIYWITILFFCVYDKCGGDYFHYRELVQSLYGFTGVETGLEDVYVWLIGWVDYSYFVFRVIVWGAALYLYSNILRYVNLTGLETIWIFLIVLLVNFSYARVSLALSLFFSGYIRLADAKHKGDRFFGLCFIVASCFFHKTMVILVLMSCLSWIKLNKTRIVILVMLFPIMVYMMNRFVGDAILMLEAGTAGAHYLSQESATQGIAAILQDTLRFAPLTMFLILIYKEYGNDEGNAMLPKYVKRLFVLALVILYTSSVLSFLNVGSNAISYRIRNMSLFPLSIILMYYIKNRKLTPLTMVCYLTLFVSDIYYFMYMYYLKLLGLGV